MCRTCGSILSTYIDRASLSFTQQRRVLCATCGAVSAASSAIAPVSSLSSASSPIVEVRIPYVLRYLMVELTAMNIRITMDTFGPGARLQPVPQP